MEDITDPEQKRRQPKANRTITVYGYVRGTQLKVGTRVHIPGCGDLSVAGITLLADPCPPPDSDGRKKKRLDQKDKVIYAPMADVGGVLYDKDATFVDIGNVRQKHNDVDQLLADDPRDQLIEEIKSADLAEGCVPSPAPSSLPCFRSPPNPRRHDGSRLQLHTC